MSPVTQLHLQLVTEAALAWDCMSGEGATSSATEPKLALARCMPCRRLRRSSSAVDPTLSELWLAIRAIIHAYNLDWTMLAWSQAASTSSVSAAVPTCGSGPCC